MKNYKFPILAKAVEFSDHSVSEGPIWVCESGRMRTMPIGTLVWCTGPSATASWAVALTPYGPGEIFLTDFEIIEEFGS